MKTLVLIAQILTTLVALIKDVEAAFEGKPGAGLEKLAAVRTALEATIDGITEAWPAIEKVIAVLVKGFNMVGLFKKSAAAQGAE